MHLFFIIVGLILLVAGGEFLVRGAVGIAVRFKISMLVVGLTIVAFGTSAPELVISVTAAVKGFADISISNIIGSNIYNISLILGISALIYAIPIESQSIKIDWPFMMIATAAFFLVSLDGVLSRVDGGILFVLIIVFTVFIIRRSRKENKDKEDDEGLPKSNLLQDVLAIVFGSIGLMYGANLFLKGAVELSKAFGVSDRIIGLTVVALGTSMPELVTSVIAAFRKRADISIGNLIGSNVFNLLTVGGLTALIKPIAIENNASYYDSWWMIGISLLLFPMLILGKKMGKIKGSILLLAFSIYLYTLF